MDPTAQPHRINFDLPHCYLEVARAALTQVHANTPVRAKDEDFELSPPLVSAKFSMVSISVIYSYLALESFVNHQLFRLWDRRHDGSVEAKNFLSELNDPSTFEKLKGNSKIRELPERIKTLCRLLQFPAPHSAIPDTWIRLSELVEASRHFLVHIYPEPEYFHSNMSRIMSKTKAGAYVRVVEELLSFILIQGKLTPPPWLTQNTLLRFRGVDLLVPL
jgi:hypothetical protein